MKASVASAPTVFLAALVAGCHPPDRKIYEESKTCIGVLDASITIVPYAQLYRAGLDRFDADTAAENALDDALKFGANAGVDRKTILAEVEAAKARARSQYADVNAPGKQAKLAGLIAAAKKCLPNDDYSGNE